MKKSKYTPHGPPAVRFARIAPVAAFLVLLTLLFTAPASADFEQVATFAEKEDQLPHTSGLAVNSTGAGGVTPGTVYGKGFSSLVGKNGIYTFGPKGESLGPWPQKEWGSKGIAIDQTTGYVYFYDPAPAGQDTIHVYSADGTKLITSFGERASGEHESFEESPEKIHAIAQIGSIAVDNSGTVYVVDGANFGEGRMMSFKPQSPGDYEHYVYTGRANDINNIGAQYLATDDAGNLYSLYGLKGEIAEFIDGKPGPPACVYEVADHGVVGIVVNAATGELFYYDSNTPKVIYQLRACKGQGELEKFELKGEITFTTKPQRIQTIAFNPKFAWEPSRPPGALYALEDTEGNPSLPIPQARGYIFAAAEIHFPVVESESVTSVTATTATLGAHINPKGSNTRYVFQYLTNAAYEANEPADRFAGATEAPLGGTELGASQQALGAAASLVGLSPDTEYRYRVIATSHCEPDQEENLCEDTGEDEAFRTFPLEAPGLPDNRAWELVSPPQKNGGEVFPLEPNKGSGPLCSPGGCKPGALAPFAFPKQSAPGGDAVVYMGYPFSATEGAPRFNEYISKRTETGWQTTILAPALFGGSGKYTAFNAELTQGALFQGSPSLTPDAPSEYRNLYTQPTANPSSLSPLLRFEPPNRSPGTFQLAYAGASEDFAHQFFAANDALTGETPFAPEAVDGGAEINSQANLYESVGGRLRLINVLPGNTETVPGAQFGSGIHLGDIFSGGFDPGHAISADGSRIYWSDKAGQLYVRIDGESTVEIPDAGKFLTASDDGSKVLLDDGHLYDLETEAITDLTEGKGGFGGIAGQSDDLSRVYFSDTAVLSGEEENDQGAKAQAGKENLYAWHEGQISFIAAPTNPTNTNPVPNGRSSESSPGGRWLAFTSGQQLTGYHNTGLCERNYGVGGGGKLITSPCTEAFLYDSTTGKLTCASCNPSGARPLGNASLPGLQAGQTYLPQPRYLLDSGRLYFDSGDSLTPSDTNRTVDNAGVEDVYQYEPEGIGSCKRQAGCISLISAGRESVDSNFLAVDETGKDVFFTSRDQLVLKDRDDLLDLYDAREGGGIASETETSRGECQGEACQALISPPDDPTPGSSSFEGAGNVEEPVNHGCPKGKVRTRGKCVKRHRPSKHHKRTAGQKERAHR